ncbi:MAG TPA: hypothetical protein DCE42_30895 [Myxococcales bacterium]|nr:hypothetical protein [Deltaproteobacteria bacterium]HAA59196.1 hypothetical protein [Myxococcales bacterium]
MITQQRIANQTRPKASHSIVLWFVLLCASLYSLPALAAPTLNVDNIKIKPFRAGIYFPANESECESYVQRHIKRQPPSKRRHYPRTIKEAIMWIKKARDEGRFYAQQGQVLGWLQSRIDQHKKGNLFLLFGNNHNIIEHYRFFNELWTPGKDGIALSGVTHLALEAFVTELKKKRLSRRDVRWMRKLWKTWRLRKSLLTNRTQRKKLLSLLVSGQQTLLDLYIHKKRRWAYRLLEVLNAFMLGRSYSPLYLKELIRTIKLARHYQDAEGRRARLDVVASDMSLRLRKKVRHYRCWLYSLREIFSLQAIHHRLKKKRNVIGYMWGSDHIRKRHFPRFVSRKDKVVSIRLQGGGMPDIWDRALLRLRLPQKPFAIVTPGAEEGDLMVHFPPKGPWIAGKALIGPISQAHLLRLTKGPKPPKQPPPLPSNYHYSLNISLQMMRRPLSFCYRKGHTSTLVRIHIAPSGRIVKVGGVHKQATGWSMPCIQRVLWRLPLPPPPGRRALEIVFILRYKPNK